MVFKVEREIGGSMLTIEVGKRASLLKFLQRTHRDRYLEIIQKLGLRK